MAVSVLKRFNEMPTRGLFTNKPFINTEELIDYEEAFLNIELLNQVLLVFLFDIFPFIDQTIKSIVGKSNDECLERYKLDSYNVLSSLAYNSYQKELKALYNKSDISSYYDCDIVQYLDSFLHASFTSNTTKGGVKYSEGRYAVFGRRLVSSF